MVCNASAARSRPVFVFRLFVYLFVFFVTNRHFAIRPATSLLLQVWGAAEGKAGAAGDGGVSRGLSGPDAHVQHAHQGARKGVAGRGSLFGGGRHGSQGVLSG